MTNAYPDQFPQHIAGRRRALLVGSFPAPPSLTPVTQAFQLWPLIKTNNELARVLKFFKVAKMDIRVTVVIRAAPTMYGAYMVSYQYGPPNGAIESLVTSNAIIGDISTSEAIDIVIPYRNTHNYLAMYPLLGTDSDEIYCTLFMTSLYTENTSGGTKSLDYDIFVALENVDGALPTADSEVYPQSSRIYQDLLASRTEHRRTQELSRYEKGVDHARFPLHRSAALGALAVGTSLKMGYDRIVGRSTQTENIEAEQIEDPADNTHGGTSKNVRQAYYGDLSTLQAQDMPTLSEEIQPSSMYNPQGMAMGTDMTIKEIGERPGLHFISSFLSTDQPGTNVNLNFNMAGNRVTTTGRQPYTYGSYIARCARYYRCDHKIALHFHTSPLVAARFRVQIYYTRVPSTIGENSGDQSYETPSEVFLIKGSQIKTFTIPFMSPLSVIPIGTTYAYMNITLLTPPSIVGTVASSVYVIGTTSHPNLSLYSLQSAFSTLPEPPPAAQEVIPQSGIRQVHDAVTETSFEGASAMVPVGMPELASLKAIISRYDTSQFPATSIDTLSIPVTREDFNAAPNLMVISLLFAFISGSIENKVTYIPGASGRKYARLGNFIEPAPIEGKVGDGEVITLLPAWPILDFRTPYRASVPMVWRRGDSKMQAVNMADVDYDIEEIDVVYLRAGRDFAMHYLNYLPPTGWTKQFTVG